MRERDETWLTMFALCLVISWVGALGAWAIPSFSTLPPIQFGLYFSGLSFAGCGFGWLMGQNDC